MWNRAVFLFLHIHALLLKIKPIHAAPCVDQEGVVANTELPCGCKNGAATCDAAKPVCDNQSGTCSTPPPPAKCSTLDDSSNPTLAQVCSGGTYSGTLNPDASLSCEGATCKHSDANTCCQPKGDDATSGGDGTSGGKGGGGAACSSLDASSTPTLNAVCGGGSVHPYDGTLTADGNLQCETETCQTTDAPTCCATSAAQCDDQSKYPDNGSGQPFTVAQWCELGQSGSEFTGSLICAASTAYCQSALCAEVDKLTCCQKKAVEDTGTGSIPANDKCNSICESDIPEFCQGGTFFPPFILYLIALLTISFFSFFFFFHLFSSFFFSLFFLSPFFFLL